MFSVPTWYSHRREYVLVPFVPPLIQIKPHIDHSFHVATLIKSDQSLEQTYLLKSSVISRNDRHLFHFLGEAPARAPILLISGLYCRITLIHFQFSFDECYNNMGNVFQISGLF